MLLCTLSVISLPTNELKIFVYLELVKKFFYWFASRAQSTVQGGGGQRGCGGGPDITIFPPFHQNMSFFFIPHLLYLA